MAKDNTGRGVRAPENETGGGAQGGEDELGQLVAYVLEAIMPQIEELVRNTLEGVAAGGGGGAPAEGGGPEAEM